MRPIRPIAAPLPATTVLRGTSMFKGILILGKLTEKLLAGMRKRIAIALPMIKTSRTPRKNALAGGRADGIHVSCGSNLELIFEELDM
jgi:hypothetical protein